MIQETRLQVRNVITSSQIEREFFGVKNLGDGKGLAGKVQMLKN